MKLSVAPPETESYGKDTLARIRTILGTDEVVMGTYVPVGDGEIRLDVRLQDTTAGESLACRYRQKGRKITWMNWSARQERS